MRASRPVAGEPDDLFEMANLSPSLPGLPMIVWISERGRDRHDVRVKVSLIRGRRARPDRTASVSLRSNVGIAAGPELEPGDLAPVREWVELNREAIIAYWNGDLLTDEVIPRLKPRRGTPPRARGLSSGQDSAR